MESDLNLIRQRRHEIARERGEAQDKLAQLQAEERELEVAERVLARLHGHHISFERETQPQFRVMRGRQTPESSRKPENVPTIPEMIDEALAVAKKAQGKSGLEPKEMVDYIAKKWWPEVTINNVGPIAWRMWKRQQLVKDGSVYSLPQNETPGTKEPGVSDHNGAGDGSPSSSGSIASDSSPAAPPGASPAHPGE